MVFLVLILVVAGAYLIFTHIKETTPATPATPATPDATSAPGSTPNKPTNNV
jgi:hypothetical protein